MVQEIPVVGNPAYHRAGILPQMLLQPVYGLGVEMVGRLIEAEARRVAEATDGTRPHGDARRQSMVTG